MSRRCSVTPLTAAGIVAGAAAATAVACTLTRILTAAPPPDGAVVFITGGSRGLGLAIASRFAQRHVRLVLVARDFSELQQAENTLLAEHPHLQPNNFYLVAADLSRPEECQRAVAEALRRFGRIDVLINNAGIIDVGPVEAHTADAFERTMRVNFFAAFHSTWAALPHMLRQDPLPGWSRRAAIVNISSIGGKFAVPHMLPYSAAKFALSGFSQGLHAELRSKGIRVTTVYPGLMRTGGEAHANFVGDKEAEQQWFNFAAKTPVIATTASHAADRIFTAVSQGRAELVITPQAWLGSLVAGLAPATVQFANSLVNRFLLPDAPQP
jgi:NAD(P)-dependent dehydrogenase (short-subunit alcohol dehydrogenase family)